MVHAEMEPAKLKVLVDVKMPDGTSRWEWQEQDGHQVKLDSVELKTGDTFSITYSSLNTRGEQ